MRAEFAIDMISKIDNEGSYLKRFTDETAFRVNGCANKHNYRTWGSEETTLNR